MIQTKTTKDYHRQIDKFIDKYNSDIEYDYFINDFINLLTEIEYTYATHGRVILNYILFKIDNKMDFRLIYRILIEICIIKYDISNYSRVNLKSYTTEHIYSVVEPIYKEMLNKILMVTSKEYLTVDDILGSQYVEDMVVHLKRKSYIVLSKSSNVNFKKMTNDVLNKINKKKSIITSTESQLTLFNDTMSVVDFKRYKDLVTTFKLDYGIEAFISECLYSAVEIESDYMDFSITWYDRYLSRHLINKFNNYIETARENIQDIINEEPIFMQSTLSILNEIANELRSFFKITIHIDPRRGDYICENVSYKRLRSAIIVNYLLVEITDLIIKNLLSTMKKSNLLNLLSEINDLISIHSSILNIFEGEVTDEYYSTLL